MDHKYFHHDLGDLHSPSLEEHQETEAGNIRKTNDQQRRSVGAETAGGEKAKIKSNVVGF